MCPRRQSAAEMAATGRYLSEASSDHLLSFWDCGSPGDKIAHWQGGADVDQGLAADFDDSLSGLGVNLSSTTYNMSEALLALPNISNMSTLLKNEAASLPSDSNSLHQNIGETLSPSLLTDVSSAEDIAGGDGASPGRPAAAVVVADSQKRQHHRFQYVLNAATSIATKVNEETLTYLNQGQSYEIRIKKLGDLTSCSDAIFRTKLKLCFHERRLQYIEKEQLDAWRTSRPGDRLLEVDLPLSYGIFDVRQDRNQLNCCEFLWSPNKDVGVYVKVHSVSTEFTPKKHGGEKGVPFRIQAETYSGADSFGALLHCAASQVKVFKLKGADRKHKQDRERFMKRPASEMGKYQPSYDCTVLTEMPVELVYSPQLPPTSAGPSKAPPPAPAPAVSSARLPNVSPPPPPAVSVAAAVTPAACAEVEYKQQWSQPSSSPTDSMNEDEGPQRSGAAGTEVPMSDVLSARATAEQTHAWLQRRRFGPHATALCNFTGADLMRLSRDDVVQLCGLADGVRLYNSLHNKLIVPRLTVYVCVPPAPLYHAFYLYQTTHSEISRKLAALLGCSSSQLRQVCVEGPGGVPVLMTDEVVRHLQNESLYMIETIPVSQESSDRLDLVLHRTVTRSPPPSTGGGGGGGPSAASSPLSRQ
ncbi:upstream-binding protein 1-like isoform X2 [Amphibalanus amphitrite]|uniref:upstream-binding protein 1-like isoform X2 n=1 Tax=Amphibalanus amphitrite TaxID=1232801 RepID=UPI001C90D1DB|nr:upstream-binding protein 1-like isoform X2 [Amphibalanus amphitrite]